MGLLGGADQEGQAASGRHEAGGLGEDSGEALDGAEGDYVEGRLEVLGFSLLILPCQIILSRQVAALLK